VTSATWRAAAAAGAVLLLGACGDKSGDSSSPTTADARSASEVTADKAGAEAAVLKISDLPLGWTAAPNPAESERTAEQRSAEAEFAECAGVDPSVIGAGSNAATRAKSDEFSDSSDHDVESSVTVIATREAAKEQLNSIRKPAVRECLASFVNRAIQSSIKNPKAGETPPTNATFGKARVQTVDLPGMHAASVAYRTTIPVTVGGHSIDVNLDIILALTGRTGITMTFTSFGAPFVPETEVELTNKVIDRAPPA
jgi:hypothetical protein